MRRQRGKRLYDSVGTWTVLTEPSEWMDYSYSLNMNLFSEYFPLLICSNGTFSENKTKSHYKWLHRPKVPLHGQVTPKVRFMPR